MLTDVINTEFYLTDVPNTTGCTFVRCQEDSTLAIYLQEF